MKNIYSLLLFSVLFNVARLYAQIAPEIEWAKCYGTGWNEYGNSIQHTIEGGYIMAGGQFNDSAFIATCLGESGMDVWIVKFDSSGNTIWQECLGAEGADMAYSVQQTPDSGFIIAGYSTSNHGMVTGNHGGPDFWVAKIDKDGNLIWQKSLGGSSDDQARSIIQTADGGFAVAGYTVSTDGDVTGHHGWGLFLTDYWIVKLDENGNLLWQKCYGGYLYDEANSIQETSDHGFIVAGFTYSTDGDVTDHHGTSDAWIIKLDSAGNLIWQRTIGSIHYEEANAIQQTSDYGFIVAGYSYNVNSDSSLNHGHNDFWVVKLDSLGNVLWEKLLGGSGPEEATSVLQTMEGNYAIAGNSHSSDGDVAVNYGNSYDYWIVKLDFGGNLIWEKSLGGNQHEFAYALTETSNGNLVIAGNSTSNDYDVTGNHGGGDFWVVKLKSDVIGISLPSINAFSFFPNPTADKLTFNCTEHSFSVTIFNIQGVQLMQQYFSNCNTATIEVGSLTSGIYLIKVDADNKRWVSKFVKE